MARSLNPCKVLAFAAVLAGACVPAHAAPTAEEKAARKKAREEKAARKQDKDGDKKDRKKDAAPDTKSADNKGGKKAPTRPPSAPTGGPLPACPPDNTLTWRSFGGGFLRTWCTGCHSSHLPADGRQDAPESVNFDTHALFKPVERLVYDRAVLEAHKLSVDPNSASPMPPAGVPPEADRRRLAQWIACGSPTP